MNIFKVSVAVARKLLRPTLPLVEASLGLLEANGGKTYFPPSVFARLKLLGIEKWAEMYLDPKKLTAMSLLGVYTLEQLDEIGRNLIASFVYRPADFRYSAPQNAKRPARKPA